MEEKEFWRLIKEAKEQGEQEEQAEWLSDLLMERGIEEIVDFEAILQQFMNMSYTSRLWGAAFVLMGGCSDDTFDYFRGWLIGQGEEIFHKVMEDPEFLAEYIDDDHLDEEGFPQNEELISLGLNAYFLIKTGDDDWDDEVHDEYLQALEEKGVNPIPDIEFDWEEEDLEELFPALWERFGEDPLPQE